MAELTAAQRTAAIEGYCADRAAKKGHAEAVKRAGISHSVCERAWFVDPRNPKCIPLHKGWATATQAQQDALVAEWRAAGLSWGHIGARTGHNPLGDALPNSLTEAQVRAAFGRATALAAEGTRNGRGGRWLADDQRLYVGNHKGLGVEAAKPLQVNRDELAKGADTYASVLPARVAAAKKAAAAGARKKAAPKPKA